MASDIVEDFEGGTDGATISTSNTGLGFADGTATFTDANGVHTGTLAALYSATAGTSYSVVYFGSPTLRSASYMRWYVTFQALPASNTLIAALRAVTTVRAEVRMNAAGTVTLRNATTAVYTSSATLSAGTTYRFEWDAINSTGQQLRVYVGDSMTTVISSGNQTYNTGTHDRMSVGLYASATWTLQVDDIETRDDFNAGSMGSAVDADVTRAQSVAITTAAAATYPAAVARAQTLASSVTAVRGAVGAVAVAQTFAMMPWLDLTLGFITGYDKRRIYGQDACTQGYTHNCWWDLGHSRARLRPLVALSVPHRIDDVHTIRFSLLGSGLHLSIERRFP